MSSENMEPPETRRPLEPLVSPIVPFYDRDGITIYCGDALVVLAEMEDQSIDVVMTDPPYSSGARNAAKMRSRSAMRRDEGKHGDNWIDGDNMTAHGFAMLVRLCSVELLRATKIDGHLFSWIDWRQWPVLHGGIESAGWTVRSCLVWDKQHFGMGNGFRQQAEFVLHASRGVADNFVRHDLGTVFRCKRDKSDVHPTMKPLAVVEGMLSAVPGDVVLDPFMGSGTTLVAAQALGKRAIGIEINEDYCRIAVERLRQGVLEFEG